MFGFFERLLALRYLRARKQEGFVSVITWFSFIGIMLGVATLIIVMSVMNGFRQELFSRVLGLGGHVSVQSAAHDRLLDYQSLSTRLRQLADVTSAAPVIDGQALITHQGVASGVAVRGVEPAILTVRPMIADKIVAGHLADWQAGSILIGSRLAQRLNLLPGDSLTLISPVGSSTAFGAAPRLRDYRIAAIFDVGMFEYDNSFVFMPLGDAQRFYRLPDAASYIEVFVRDPQQIDAALRSRLQQAALQPVQLVDWRQANASFTTALEVERNVMFLILALIILVAAFNIISSLIMLVQSKGRDIAILRTIGTSRGAILRVFILAGACIGVVGTALGTGLGLAVALNIETIRQGIQGLTGADLFAAEIYFLSQLPAVVDWGEVAQVTGLSLLLSLLATLYPAWRAAQLDPIEALRYE